MKNCSVDSGRDSVVDVLRQDTIASAAFVAVNSRLQVEEKSDTCVIGNLQET